MASTARAIAGVSLATACATFASSRFIKRTIVSPDIKSRFVEAGLRRSVRRWSERMDEDPGRGTTLLYRCSEGVSQPVLQWTNSLCQSVTTLVLVNECCLLAGTNSMDNTAVVARG